VAIYQDLPAHQGDLAQVIAMRADIGSKRGS
jgi:hypothetical protein